MPPSTITLVDQGGRARDVPIDEVGAAIAAGYHAESAGEHVSRVDATQKADTYGGIGGKIAAGITSFNSGATLGLSDVLGSAMGMGDDLSAVRSANPTISTVGNIAGTIAPAILSAGALTPAGAVSRASARIAESGTGGVLEHAAAGALEGAAQNAGSYVSQVALGDKELSAEGFVGAMGEGAMFGGGAAGALKVGAGALSKARGLFAKARPAAEAATAAGEVAPSFLDSPTFELADEPVGRARTMAPEASAYSETPASRMFGGDVNAQAEAATREAQDALGGHFDATDEALMIGQRRIKQAQDIEDIRIGKRGGQSDWSAKMDRIDATEAPPTKAAFDPEAGMREMQKIHADSIGPETADPVMDAAGIARKPRPGEAAAPTLEEQLGQMKSKLDAGSSMGEMRMDAATREIAEKRAALEAAHHDVLAMLDKEHLRPYEGAKTVDDRIGIAMKGLEGLRKPSVAEQIATDATRGIDSAAPKSLDEQIGDALTRRTSAPDADLKEVIAKLSSYEQKSADYAAALGDEAPPALQAHAKDYNASVAEQHAKVAQQTATGAGQVENAMGAVAGSAAAPSKAGRILKGIQDASAAVHVLHSLGINGIPDPSNIPVIGPLLGLYLKARAMMMVGKRMGLKVPQTAESVIASKASGHVARITSAVDRTLSFASKGLASAAPKAGGTAAILGHKLFDDGTPPTGLHTDSLAERRDELVRAQRPGAVAAMVRDRVRASDPELLDEITKAMQRKLDYEYKMIPKPPTMPGMLPGAVAAWQAAPGLVTSFARTVAACEDPAGVLEQLADNGQVSYEAAEALRNVYPRLYQTAQQQILLKAQDQTKPMPYAKRVQLSVLFGVPLDGTMTPGYLAAIAAPYRAPQGQPQGSAPPMSAMTADVTLGARTSTGLDQRGAR